MADQDIPVLVGRIVEEEAALTLDELSGLCALEQRTLIELVEEGAIETCSQTEMRFAGDALRRARIAARLQRDLGVNAAGIALALQLLDRIDALERRLGELP